MRLRDSLLSAMDRLDPASLHGFITAYGFLCDFFSVPINEGVTWVSPCSLVDGLTPPLSLSTVSEECVSDSWIPRSQVT